MFNHVLDERILHIRRVGDGDVLIAITRLQADGHIVEHGETDESLGADNLNAVLTGAFMRHIAPRATAWQTVFETEAGTHRVLHDWP